VLEDTNKTNNADDSKGKYGELLREFVHVILQRGSPLLDILHHAKDDAKLGLGPSGNGDA
jgi:hypothetical protein